MSEADKEVVNENGGPFTKAASREPKDML